MAENVIEFTDATFSSDVLDSEQVVLVDFWAPWCGPCRMLAPTIEAVAQEYTGRVKVGKINTDNNRQSAIRQQVEALPTVQIFKGGEVVERFVGVVSKEKITAAIEKHL